MSCKKNLRFFLSAVIMTIVVMITIACAQKEIKEDASGIETPPAQAEEIPAPAVTEAPAAELPAPEPASSSTCDPCPADTCCAIRYCNCCR